MRHKPRAGGYTLATVSCPAETGGSPGCAEPGRFPERAPVGGFLAELFSFQQKVQ